MSLIAKKPIQFLHTEADEKEKRLKTKLCIKINCSFLKIYILLICFLIPFISLAQDPLIQEKGIDERINEWFAPIASWWEGVVFYTLNISENVQVPFVVILLVGGAIFFTIYFSFVNIRKFPLAIRVVQGKYDFLDKDALTIKSPELSINEDDHPELKKEVSHHGEVSHFQALATAVSGTVGLGNIAGVAIAIAIGGPGATLWMILAGLLGMSSKFVECTLGVKYRDIDKDGTVFGGPMYYLQKGLKERNMGGLGKILAILFAILCVGGSFGGGNAFQSNQATQQITSLMGVQGGSVGFFIGVILALLTGLVIIGGIKRIATVTEKLVPFMAILYIISSLIIIFSNFTLIDDAFTQIISQAFNPAAGVGGVAGVIVQGFRRAAFSNEAGAGSAAIAHSAVSTKYPASEGIVSLLEPFIDTVVICTMTAVVIVLYNMNGVFAYGGDGEGNVIINATGKSVSGVDLTSLAYNDVIPYFSYVLTVAIVLFAFSTMISWSYYGLQAWKFLFGRGKVSDLSYKILFLLFVIIGASATLGAVISFSDAMILAMVFPNMIGLFLLFPKVQDEMKRYLLAIKNSTIKKII